MARGEIVNVEFPLIPSSRVQGGRRPAVLVIADTALRGNPMRMVIPLTTNLNAVRFPFTLQIDPSSNNGLSAPSIALVFQLCAIDSLQIASVRGQLEDSYVSQIDAMMRQMLGF